MVEVADGLGQRLTRALSGARGRAAGKQRPAAAAPPARAAAATTSGTALTGQPRAVRSWEEVVSANLGLVQRALDGAGIDWFVIDHQPNARPIVVVTAPADRVWAALAAASDRPSYAVGVAGRKKLRPRPLAEDAPPAEEVWRIFDVVTTPGGNPLASDDAACELQFWRETTPDTPPLGNHEVFPAGSLLAPVMTNRWTHVVPAPDRELVLGQVAGLSVPVLAATQRPHIFETRWPIDVVYTWVDATDQAWRTRLEAALGAGTGLHELSANPSRFDSYDELRYSLRSVELYANWVRRIFLVTEGHLPAWLDTTNPRLQVVTHAEIFTDPSVLPTFNSHAIESQLHHIDGLSEHFLYLNDDVFFTAPARPEQYVLANGTSVFFPSSLKIGVGPAVAGDTPVVHAAKHNRELIERSAGVTPSQRMKHVAHSLRRSVLAEVEQTFADEVRATAAARFRQAGDLAVASSLAHYVGFLSGRATPGVLKALYADVADPATPGKLADLLAGRDHAQLCLNETRSDPAAVADRRRLVGEFLEAYFPVPSSFEKADA